MRLISMNPILGSASAATTGVALNATRPPAAESKWRRVIMGPPMRQLMNSLARCGWLSKFSPAPGMIEMARGHLDDLLAFPGVGREHSFPKAAAKLGVSQSSLSHTIRELEARLWRS